MFLCRFTTGPNRKSFIFTILSDDENFTAQGLRLSSRRRCMIGTPDPAQASLNEYIMGLQGPPVSKIKKQISCIK